MASDTPKSKPSYNLPEINLINPKTHDILTKFNGLSFSLDRFFKVTEWVDWMIKLSNSLK